MKFSVQPASAAGVVRQAGDRVEDLSDVAREARGVDAGDAGSFLVGGAVSVFFEERAEVVEKLRNRAETAVRVAAEVIEVYEAGDREMAAQTEGLARRGDALGGGGRAW
ncbi:hypothetical protein APR04_005389 [Promicromonospora umidemergens]|uniref:Excreted virulence factor EspC (Type VII ESX diderm) n=1 Tax=Promicromonospora umidemergens TaxID=629679 RepID=A0ABP8Y9G4_9MICO|nr:DUF6507 family protein [Promicromonospora umidemergens]MCP2286452.1 hypothetical protein [Promicromonospora umidemergens]